MLYYHVLSLMYLMGAATDTTTESLGRPSMSRLRRCSYSSVGIPGVSSCGLTGLLSVELAEHKDDSAHRGGGVKTRPAGHSTRAWCRPSPW